MKQWEYFDLAWTDTGEDATAVFNPLGAEGWELVNVVMLRPEDPDFPNTGWPAYCRAFFKRELVAKEGK